jgi:CRISPR-associated endonuclease/helicase Cas3
MGVIVPEGEPADSSWMKAIAPVYLPVPLERTWDVLRNRDSVAVPGDLRTLVDAVYPGDATQVEGVAQEEARRRLIPNPDASGTEVWPKLTDLDLKDEDSAEVQQALVALTRLGDPSVRVVCLYGDEQGASLRPGGEEPVDLSAPPTGMEAKRRLLERSLTLSGFTARLLLKKPPVPGWQSSALLGTPRVPVGPVAAF